MLFRSALLKLATPLQISQDGVIITFKNDRLVAQINDTNKKQLIIDAANIMFNQSSTTVTIRTAQSGDKPVKPTAEIKTSINIPQAPIEEQKIEEPVKVKETKSVGTELSKESISEEQKERLETDQEKMVLELFDGKYIE